MRNKKLLPKAALIILAIVIVIATLCVCFALKKRSGGTIQSNSKSDASYPEYVLNAAGTYKTAADDAVLSIDAVTEDGYVYYTVYWYDMGGFSGVSKVENDIAEVEYESDYMTVSGHLTLLEDKVELDIESVSVDYIPSGKHEFLFSDHFPQYGSSYCEYNNPGDLFLSKYLDSQGIEYSYEYWTVSEVPLTYEGKDSAGIYDLYKIVVDGKVEFYLGSQCVEKPFAGNGNYDLFYIGGNNVLQLVQHFDENGTSDSHDEINNDVSSQTSQIGAYEIPYVEGTFSKIGETYSTFHVESSGLKYSPNSQLILMYREYSLNNDNWVELGATDCNGYSSKVGVVNDRIVIDIQDVAQGSTVGESLPADILSMDPCIEYGFNDDGTLVEQMLIWRRDNGYMVAFATTNDIGSGSYKNERLKYVITTTDLNYIAAIPPEVLSTNPTF